MKNRLDTDLSVPSGIAVMIRPALTALLLVPSMLMAQDSFKFKIEGKVDALKTGYKIFLVYQLEDRQITDSAVLPGFRASWCRPQSLPTSC
ncbi:hypothetical protein SAMN05216311_112191 [Chitinophaga sp. CF418]|nr:hypothetical protein SAMN05216311_112191 [Chitinophaga sp. CF418]